MRDETPTRRHVSAQATGITKPAGAVSSAFDVAGKTGTAHRYATALTLDPSKVQIVKNRPLPPRTNGWGSASAYANLLSRMKPGDSVDLPIKAAKSLVSRAKKLGLKPAIRILDKETAGVWLLDKEEA